MNRFKGIIILLILFTGLASKGQSSKDSINRGKLALTIGAQSSFYIGGISYLGFIWYKDADRVPFHYYNDNKGYLQIDKFGHAYGAYLESKLSYNGLRASGVSKKNALIYGGTMGLIMQTPIEIFDGLYEGWGFSWGDMAANAAGSALLIGQELLWEEQKVLYKFSFTRSPYADGSNGMLGDNQLESLLLDYNGHSYWLSTNLNNLIPSDKIPSWINLAVGYSANGMYGEFENKYSWGGVVLPEAERHRQYLLSLDIDWLKIPTDNWWLKQLFSALNYVKLPFPALEYNRIDGFTFNTLYF